MVELLVSLDLAVLELSVLLAVGAGSTAEPGHAVGAVGLLKESKTLSITEAGDTHERGVIIFVKHSTSTPQIE